MNFKEFAETHKTDIGALKLLTIILLISLALELYTVILSHNYVDVTPKEENMIYIMEGTQDILLSEDENYVYVAGYNYRWYEDSSSKIYGYIKKINRDGETICYYSGARGYIDNLKFLPNGNIQALLDPYADFSLLEFNTNLELITTSQIQASEAESLQKSSISQMQYQKNNVYYKYIDTSDGGMFAVTEYSDINYKPTVGYYKSKSLHNFNVGLVGSYHTIKSYLFIYYIILYVLLLIVVIFEAILFYRNNRYINS